MKATIILTLQTKLLNQSANDFRLLNRIFTGFFIDLRNFMFYLQLNRNEAQRRRNSVFHLLFG